MHPLGKSPVICDGELTLAESGAIIEYLVDSYGSGRLKPAAGTPESHDYRFWLHHAEGSLMPPLVMSLVLSRLEQPPVPWWLRPLARKLAAGVRGAYLQPLLTQLLAHADRQLARTGWFAGAAFSAADIQMSFPLEAARARGVLNAEHPRALDFLCRIHARPAYRAALEQGTLRLWRGLNLWQLPPISNHVNKIAPRQHEIRPAHFDSSCSSLI